MKKFNIRKVLDGLTAASSSSSATAQPGTPKENDVVQETLQSEHFQLCKVGFRQSRLTLTECFAH